MGHSILQIYHDWEWLESPSYPFMVMGMVDDIGFTTLIYPLPEKQLEEIDTRVGDKEKADDVGNKADDA